MADNGEFANGDTPTKRVKGRKTQEENANDFCRLCGVNLKIKFGNFQKVPNTFPRKIYLNLQVARSEEARH